MDPTGSADSSALSLYLYPTEGGMSLICYDHIDLYRLLLMDLDAGSGKIKEITEHHTESRGRRAGDLKVASLCIPHLKALPNMKHNHIGKACPLPTTVFLFLSYIQEDLWKQKHSHLWKIKMTGAKGYSARELSLSQFFSRSLFLPHPTTTPRLCFFFFFKLTV